MLHCRGHSQGRSPYTVSSIFIMNVWGSDGTACMHMAFNVYNSITRVSKFKDTFLVILGGHISPVLLCF